MDDLPRQPRMNEQYYSSSRRSNTTILPETSAAEPRLSAPSLVDTRSSTTFGPQGNTPYMESPSSYNCCVSRSYYTHSNSLYQQVPLPLTSNLPDLSKPTIRLICLKPGRDWEPLECTLFCVSLEVSVQFTALSYVWGDATIQYPITVNGCVIGITTSLYAALLQLRKPNSASVLWADAICIDQKNLEERSCQVKQMPNIYGKAEEVIAWLGEADSNSNLAMDYIADHGGRRRRMAERCDNLTFEIANSLNILWSRPYWNRVWVVQELASAYRSRHRCIFRCGDRSVSYHVLRKFLQYFLAKSLITSSDSVLSPRRMITLSSSNSHMPILELLWDSAPLQSSDPRDRIYGIRGISPQFYRDTIKVDYTLDYHKLCSKFMTFHINKERSLDILCCFERFRPFHKHASWLCDLRQRISGLSPFTYACFGSRQAVANILNGVLYARGIHISSIKDIRGPFQTSFPIMQNFHNLVPEMHELERLASASLEMCEMENLASATLELRYPDEDWLFRKSRFMDMIAGDRQHEADGSLRSKIHIHCRQLWDKMCRMDLTSAEEMSDDCKKFSLIFERLNGRCFFTSFDNHVGLGPPDIQEGDLICILYGCRLCVILREKGPDYHFVGPAYVDGLMSGDYVCSPMDEGKIKAKERKFSIR